MATFDRIIDSLIVIKIIQITGETRWDVLMRILEEVKKSAETPVTNSPLEESGVKVV